MKDILLLLALTGGFFSCSISSTDSNEETNSQSNTQKWQLTKMTGSMVNSETTGDEMAWQETYSLKADNTFVKTRMENGQKKEASGTYRYVTLSDGKYLELTYDSVNELIGNCTSEPKELLKVDSEDKLSATWQACDGPGLVYERVK